MLDEKEFFVRKAIGWVLWEMRTPTRELVFEWLLPRAARASGDATRGAQAPVHRAASSCARGALIRSLRPVVAALMAAALVSAVAAPSKHVAEPSPSASLPDVLATSI